LYQNHKASKQNWETLITKRESGIDTSIIPRATKNKSVFFMEASRVVSRMFNNA